VGLCEPVLKTSHVDEETVMNQLGDDPEEVRKRLEVGKRHARKKDREPADRAAGPGEAPGGERPGGERPGGERPDQPHADERDSG
jgi:hypothetical protein